LKFHLKIVYKESLKDYLTTSKRIDLFIENLNCNPSLSAAPFEIWIRRDVFAILTKETALLFDANHGRQEATDFPSGDGIRTYTTKRISKSRTISDGSYMGSAQSALLLSPFLILEFNLLKGRRYGDQTSLLNGTRSAPHLRLSVGGVI
jgi:hypothetical protein